MEGSVVACDPIHCFSAVDYEMTENNRVASDRRCLEAHACRTK